jgi:hypothetical protein
MNIKKSILLIFLGITSLAVIGAFAQEQPEMTIMLDSPGPPSGPGSFSLAPTSGTNPANIISPDGQPLPWTYQVPSVVKFTGDASLDVSFYVNQETMEKCTILYDAELAAPPTATPSSSEVNCLLAPFGAGYSFKLTVSYATSMPSS